MTDDALKQLRDDLKVLESDVSEMKSQIVKLDTTQGFINKNLDQINANTNKLFWLLVTTLISVFATAGGLLVSGKIVLG